MKIAVLIGATGLTGSYLLQLLLNSDVYKKVVVFVRKDTGLKHGKLEQHVIDFDYLENYASYIKGDDFFNCMGTTIKKAKTKENFEKIDLQIPLQFATLAKSNGMRCMVSIASYMSSARSFSHYLRTKGRLEEALQKLGFEFFVTLRPSFLVGERAEPRIVEKFMNLLMRSLNYVLIGRFKNLRSVHITVLAQAMFHIAQSDQKGMSVLESGEIPAIGEKR